MENLTVKIILNVLGILIFFFARLQGRDKSIPLSATFWIKDNWEQLVIVALFDIASMILVFIGGLQVNLERLAPMLSENIQLAGDGATCFLVGLILAWALYVAYKKIVIDKR